jgi:histone-lysine N-methyltransferase SETD2
LCVVVLWGIILQLVLLTEVLFVNCTAVIDDKTCEERLWVMKEQGEINFYMCEISREMVIDATFKGNLSRYINHSCHPNSELQKW